VFASGLCLSDRYVIDSLMGQGGMGEVYCAHDRELDRDVAVKVMSRLGRSSPSVVERFLRQARAAARIGYPGIVEIYDCGMHESIAYVVMQKLEGESLAKRIARLRGVKPMPTGFDSGSGNDRMEIEAKNTWNRLSR